MNRFRWIALVLMLCTLAGAGIAPAQTTPPPPPASAAAPISQELLDSLLAPIALYPDQLLSQVLMASTYPLEVVEAARFVKANPGLSGEGLDRALEGKAWDASVLSLCAFPQVLDMMDAKLEWTQRLGDAFLADEAAVMRTVQSLRLRAQQAGNLQSTPQQNVVVQEQAIVIEPAQPEFVYVPVYNPEIIYGPWWAPAYRPWYWYPGPIWGYPAFPSTWGYAAGIFWGTAWAINAYNWGWCRPNWGGYRINVNVHGHNPWANRPYYRDRYANSPNWSHAPEHRRGVAYRDPGTAQRYRPANPGAVQTRESYRGRDVRTGPGYGGGYARPVPGVGNAARPGQGASSDIVRPAPGAATPSAPGAPGGVGSSARPGTSVTTQPAPRPALGAPAGTGSPVSPVTGLTTRRAPAPQRPGDPGSTTRPAPSPDRPPIMGSTTRPPAPPAQAAPRPAPTTSQFAARPAPAASYAQPAYRPETRPQIQRDAARGAQSRAAMSQPAPQTMRGSGGGASRATAAPGAPSGGQRGGQSGGQGGGPVRQR